MDRLVERGAQRHVRPEAMHSDADFWVGRYGHLDLYCREAPADDQGGED